VVGKITKKIPGPLVAIAAVTSLVQFANIDTKTLGDLAAISGIVPILLIVTTQLLRHNW
jgi:SulP family sulfate permease